MEDIKIKTVYDFLRNDTNKRIYFYWRNNAKTRKYNFLEYNYTKEEFINQFLDGDKKEFRRLEKWETTDQYSRTQKYYYVQEKDKDFVLVYEAVREKALTGDNQAVKTFLMLQKELQKNVIEECKQKQKQKEDKDDGLDLSLN